MNIIFMRHGEATGNVKEIISDREIYWSVLTEDGINTALESISSLPDKIDKIYVSPFPRTIETAHFVHEKYPKTEVIIENRLHEINHGKYSGKQNNEDLDNTRIKQINGDYFIRFGEYGENKYEIEERLCDFLREVYNNNFDNNTIMIVSHGSITSYMKRLLSIKSAHINVGKIEEFINVDFTPLFNYMKELRKIKKQSINAKIKRIEALETNQNLKQNLTRLVKKEFNSIEFPDSYFDELLSGLQTKKLKQITNPRFEAGIILVCFYNNFEKLVDTWMKHYISIGINNFVLVNNNSTDKSTELLKKYESIVNISFWQLDENYNCYKMCGWKQLIFEKYGVGCGFLTVDSDELFIYENYKNTTLADFITKNQLKYIKSMMLDVYSNKNIYEGKIEDYKYVDKGTYKITSKVAYKQRFYGGPRTRIFNITPSLQKIPYIKYTGKELFVNDHYYYPWSVNEKAKFCSYLLHYKFLPGDKKMYEQYAVDGRHWNNSHEYKIYSNILSNKLVSFYNKDISVLIDEIDYKF